MTSLLPGVPRDLHWCPYHGPRIFEPRDVIDNELARTWRLTESERKSINRQQGLHCPACFVNLRESVLASAVVESQKGRGLTLEVNRCGNLTDWLKERARDHVLVEYPQVDMQDINTVDDDACDLVVHSDVLEHVFDPVKGLRECHRVLKHGAALIYTVPCLPNRVTYRREDTDERSSHGPDRVYTEYGADFWIQPMLAGFKRVNLSGFFPDAFALTCWKDVA